MNTVDSDSDLSAIRANVIQGMDLVYSQTKSGVDSCDVNSDDKQIISVQIDLSLDM